MKPRYDQTRRRARCQRPQSRAQCRGRPKKSGQAKKKNQNKDPKPVDIINGVLVNMGYREEQMEYVNTLTLETAETFLKQLDVPGASDPGASDPGASDPSASDPGASDPGASDPGASDPGASDPSTSDPGASDPSTSDPGASDPSASDPGASDPGASDPGASDPGASDPSTSLPYSSRWWRLPASSPGMSGLNSTSSSPGHFSRHHDKYITV
nr:spermidine/spermine N(1)-acetyltransferase-like protein 1 [Procambarus clarkii]